MPSIRRLSILGIMALSLAFAMQVSPGASLAAMGLVRTDTVWIDAWKLAAEPSAEFE